MDDLLDITYERRTKDGRSILRTRETPNDIAIIAAVRIDPTASTVLLHLLKQIVAERLGHV